MDEQAKQAGEAGAEAAERAGNRVIGWVRRRPLTSLGILAGIGVLGGAEWAVGALIGGAAAALFSRRSGAEMRHDLRERARQLADRARGRLEAARRHHQEPSGRAS
jgi:hypothetical protein